MARATATAMAPMLQQLSSAGLVVLPSLLAGQLLGGAQPAQVLTLLPLCLMQHGAGVKSKWSPQIART